MSNIAKIVAGIAAGAGMLISRRGTRSVRLPTGDKADCRLRAGRLDRSSVNRCAEAGERLGQTIVVENRAGAGGQSGPTHRQGTPDGYTRTLGTTSTHAIAPACIQSCRTTPCGLHADSLGQSRLICWWSIRKCRPKLERVPCTREEPPAKLKYASAGNGTAPNLAMGC